MHQLIPSLLKEEQHVIFAKAKGADFHISCDSNRLADEQVSRWFDNIFYPAVRQLTKPRIRTHLLTSEQKECGEYASAYHDTSQATNSETMAPLEKTSPAIKALRYKGH
ncbi:Uncharacterized protein HZ326_30715 [Fusarium oxysporum f. sp. albedinis]|nr:Uncharacterized protein HZ326_30715 [Fusarium oxysporum f. sp. albedinis]